MLAGIQEFLVISTPKDLPQYQYSLGNGEQWGISIVYAEQDRPDGIAQALIVGEDFIAQGPTALILGDNVFYGEGLPRILRSISERDGGATIFGYKVHDPERYGVVLLNDHGTPLEIVEKPLSPKSKFAIPGLYFYDGQASQIARSLQPSSRGELEISDLNRAYLAEGNPQVELLGRGYAWLDSGTHESLLQASNFVQVVESRTGLKVACPEEVAYRLGYIGAEDVIRLAGQYTDNDYGRYLIELVNEVT